MAIKKIENVQCSSKATSSSSAISIAWKRGPLAPEPRKRRPTPDDIGNIRKGVGHMDGLQRTAFESKITIVNLTKLTEGVMAFNQGNVEALMKSGQVWAAGCVRNVSG